MTPKSAHSNFDALTLLDVATLFGGARDDVAAFDKAVSEQLLKEGGLVITGFPGAEEIDDLGAMMLQFFNLPNEEKDRLAIGPKNPANSHLYRGYIPNLKQGVWAYNELFDIGPKAPFLAPDIPGLEMFSEDNIWPSEEPCTGWRLAMERYYEIMERLSNTLVLSLGRGFGYDDVAIKARFRKGNHTLRLLNYPTPPDGHYLREEQIDGTRGQTSDRQSIPLSSDRHFDASGLSLLWQRQVGLQAQSSDGNWRNVPMFKNTISIHVGNALSGMTESKIPATPHRVLDLKQHRQSIGFFLEPALSTQMGALHKEGGGHEGTYGWHLRERFYNHYGRENY